MALVRDYWWTPSTLDDKFSSFVYNDHAEKKILREIISILSVDDEEHEDKIIKDLLVNGRQSLVKYEDDIISKVYQEIMSGNDSELMVLLKKFYEHKFKTNYSRTAPWLALFLEHCRNGENRNIYDRVLTRTADYGFRYMKNCPILSVVLQLLFEGIDDACLNAGNAFDQLWYTIINDGIKSIKKFSDYISESKMNKQLKKESILFQALREYYRENIITILRECNIRNRDYLYALVVDDIVEDGWWADLKSIKDDLTPRSYRMLLASIESLKQNNFVWSKVQCSGCNMMPVIGKRYRCETCGDYDLCTYCQARGHPHDLIVIPMTHADRNNENVQNNKAVKNESYKKKKDSKKHARREPSIEQEDSNKQDSDKDKTNKEPDQSQIKTKFDDEDENSRKQANESKATDQQNSESKVSDQQANESKATDQQNSESKVSDQQDNESKVTDQQDNQTKSTDQPNSEIKDDTKDHFEVQDYEKSENDVDKYRDEDNRFEQYTDDDSKSLDYSLKSNEKS